MELYSTKDINQKRSAELGEGPVWVFGYGSLIYKVDFPFIAKKTGYITGWQRRFWMASQDHRGTPRQPGRVLTIHPVAHARCFGVAYLIEPEILVPLDHREQNGYLRENIQFTSASGEAISAITYVGDPKAPVYQKEDHHQVIADIIVNSTGPSGPNRDYLFDMAQALRDFDEVDEYIFEIEKDVRARL